MVQRPFQVVGVDIMDLPLTDTGNRHVLVFQDFLVYPMPDQKTNRIVDFLVKEVVPMFGVPEKLHSYRGTNLLFFLVQDVCHLLGIQKINTTAYHPQTNEMVERFNRTLKTMLRKHVELWGKQWDQHLYAVLHAYRNTPHDTTREKPSYLLFGKDLRTPTEAAYLPETKNRNVESLETYREKLMTGLTVARRLAGETMLKAQKKYEKYYD